MLAVLNGLLPLKCLVYLDDVLVMGRTFEQHLQNLDDVLQAIDRAGLRLKLSKCSFAKPSVDFLGFTVSAAGLAPNVTNVEAIREFPTPQNLTEFPGYNPLLQAFYFWFQCHCKSSSSSDKQRHPF